jgi:release factor glutamine methyltransferase
VATEIAQLIDEGVARLARVTDQPRLDAEILLAAALAKPRSYLLAHPEQRVLDCEATDRFEAHVTRRAHGEPIAYILGEKEFWSLPIEVGPDVLIPRPETELAVELALGHLPASVPGRVLDVATGSGAIALALAHERPRQHVIGTDVAEAAVARARSNAARLGLANVQFRHGSWFEPVRDEHFTLIVSNPPYIAEDDPRVERAVRRFEPHAALFAGPTGLEALRVLAAGAPDHLVPGGWLILEHGDTQAAAVRGLLHDAGFESVRTACDLAGRDRCTEGRRPGPARPAGA